MVFVIEIEGLEARDSGEVEVEAATGFFDAGEAAFAGGDKAETSGHRGRVEFAFTGGVDADGEGAEPPIDDVEVVRGLVKHEAAGIGFVGVPATAVVGAVAGFDHPLKINREDIADLAAHQEVLHVRAGRRVALVEIDAEVAAGAVLGFEDAAARLGGGRHRFFRDDVAAARHGTDDLVAEGAVGLGDDDDFGSRLDQQALKPDGRIDVGWRDAVADRPGASQLETAPDFGGRARRARHGWRSSAR